MWDILMNIALVVVIAGSGAVFTQVYCKLAYYTCANCKSLNAKRRSECRNCGASLEKE
jgi:hypothetical protein